MTQTVLLGDIVKHFKGVAFKSSDYQESGVPIVKVSNFTDNSIDTSSLDHIPENVAKENKKVTLKNGDIIIATVGSWPNNPASVVGKTIRVPESADSALLNQNAVCLRHKANDGIEQKYLYYSLKDPRFIDYLVGGAQGSANQASITLDNIFRFKLNFPEKTSREEIVYLLSGIDEKIELNRRMNETLEQIGQALFRHYFIDNPEAQNWKTSKLKEIIENVKKPLMPGPALSNRIYLPVDHLQMNSLSILNPLDSEEAKSSLISFEKDDILVGAMRVYFHRVNIAPAMGVTRTTTFVLRAKADYLKAFVALLLNENATINYANAHSKGTTMPYAIWDNGLGDMQTHIPSTDILIEFNMVVWPMLEKIRDSYLEIQALTILRDTLLPRLISGKIKI